MMRFVACVKGLYEYRRSMITGMKRSGRIPSLDGIRAIAVLLVVLGHAHSRPDGPGWLAPVGDFATLGVRIFFVLSGFLITGLLLKEHKTTGTVSLRNFYIRRAYRIFPAAIAAVIGIAIISHHFIDKWDVIWSFLYLQNYNGNAHWSLNHMWTLAVEEQFYLVWPFLLSHFFNKRYKVLLAALVIAPLCRAGFGYVGLHQAEAEWFPCVVDSLATGALLAIGQEQVRILTRWLSGWTIPIFLVFAYASTLRLPPGVQPLLLIGLENVSIALAIQHCIDHPYFLLNWRPVIWLGGLSYSWYLWQMPFFQPGMHGWQTRFPVNILCGFVLAVVCHYSIEKPFLRLRELRHPHVKSSKVASLA